MAGATGLEPGTFGVTGRQVPQFNQSLFRHHARRRHPQTAGKLKLAMTRSAPEPAEYLRDHDDERGRPVANDRQRFEKICLDGFQSGLSWLTILRKRDNFRAAFAGFDFAAVARFRDKDVARLLKDPGIVRHRGKIESVINNAGAALAMVEETGSLAAFFWRFEPDAAKRPRRLDWDTLRRTTTSPESIALSKELKRRGWSFVGPTTVYSFMQSIGLVNDHLTGCFCREAVESERRVFRRPGR
jgi:DNA-3-methyladenine glycosylase I